MKFVVAVHGTRGDVEPCAAVGLELQRRGHDVVVVVPPNLVSLIERAGLRSVVAWGPSSENRVLSWDRQAIAGWTPAQDDGAPAARRRLPNPVAEIRHFQAYLADGWAEMSTTLAAVAQDADLILTGLTYQEVAANVAERYGVKLAAIHYVPIRANTVSLPVRLPRFLVDRGYALSEWVFWRMLKPAEDEQRRTLGLPSVRTRSARRVVEQGTLEIQAYDNVLFPGLDEEWAGRRPFVGALTMQLSTTADDDVAAWIDAGPPPIYFGFGSTPVEDPAKLLDMIESVCAELGERALVNSSSWTEHPEPRTDAVKVVRSANFPMVFPRCRVLVHHGGSGTVAEGLKAGVPTVALWSTADQPVWSSRIKALKLGTARRFSTTTRESLLADLRTVLGTDYARRARALAARMTATTDGVTKAADLLEAAATAGRGVGRPD